jgi:hypothetical protein
MRVGSWIINGTEIIWPCRTVWQDVIRNPLRLFYRRKEDEWRDVAVYILLTPVIFLLGCWIGWQLQSYSIALKVVLTVIGYVVGIWIDQEGPYDHLNMDIMIGLTIDIKALISGVALVMWAPQLIELGKMFV